MGQRVLVVDDNRDSAMTMCMLLQAMGHECEQAYDGLEALSAAEQFQPSLMLLDFSLPDLNGGEVCRRIRQQPWGQNIRMVAVTGWNGDDDRKFDDAGFDGHLVKPVPFNVLQQLLSELE